MKNRISITEYLKNDKTQRLIYGGILLLWIFVGLNFVKYKYDFSPFYFDIFYAMVIPTIILIAPIIMNRKIFWLLAFGFTLLHGIWTTYKITFDFSVNFHRDYIPNQTWNLKDIGISVLLIIVSFLATWIIWKMKPMNKNTMHNTVHN
ncbi:hypothetical protein [Tenacibaculum halocynthiae]|uniref:hypothetical protein n=1 Tax=Tenacibaculum halocynthiae TaxID=1254437 RepID=UPI00389535C4